MAEQAHRAILGSEWPRIKAAVRGEPVPGDEVIRISVLVRRRASSTATLSVAIDLPRAPLSRAEFRDRFGADVEELGRVAEVLQGFGLRVHESHVARRTITLSGTSA